MDDLIKRLRSIWISPGSKQEACEDAANLIEQQVARIAELEQELRNIANADTVEWDDPSQFEAWAKSRARHTLAQIGKEK